MSFALMIRVLVLALLIGFPLAGRAATVLVFGDSISAGYGLPTDAGWVHLLRERLKKFGPDYRVVNASISGETASGGRRRIQGVLQQFKPDIVVVELGGNDGLRGAGIPALRSDLDAIVAASLKNSARVLLVGMQLPPNYGADYVERFQAVYSEVAAKHRVPLVPFLFDGFGSRPEYFQGDGIHPTRAAQPLMLETVWRHLEPMLKRR
jgi:acyl-CoA thioesterase-1